MPHSVRGSSNHALKRTAAGSGVHLTCRLRCSLTLIRSGLAERSVSPSWRLTALRAAADSAW